MYHYELNIDGDLLKEQKRWLYSLASSIPSNPNLEGIIALLDEITDQAHDKYGIDCLLECEVFYLQQKIKNRK